ncbi:GntR family transcriptional regulator [Dysgonomonas sp. 520]|uniref:GntR family transcriptional regulator n=1 Tax=Dysgonomonas sp. 520 TaxID=2302931 RepID=UPI0013D06641|nr:GntR family transcriptional regulator [Dysgonomonas sp. 520]NDW09047.1 GntR family transcriptional regulator [Dysgonomonas sp. 520]
MELRFDQNKSKVRQLADAIRMAISSGEFKEGDILPSINKISSEHGLARDTVYKAFQELKEKGIIESAPTKGYFVSKTVNNIFVLLDIFSPYKDDFYKELTANLPLNYKLDLYFHHYNERAFNHMMLDCIGRYDLYLITNIANDMYSDVLDRLDNSKVLLIDLGKFKKDKFSYVCQGFDTTLYDCLTSGLNRLKKYKEIDFIIRHDSEHPKSCIPYFIQFCEDNNFNYKFIESDFGYSDVTPGTAYLVASHNDMIRMVKLCRSLDYKLGEDVGLITFNDAPMLEVIENGITVISTDFKQMGKLAAEYIKTRNKVQTYIPTKLICRGSL